MDLGKVRLHVNCTVETRNRVIEAAEFVQRRAHEAEQQRRPKGEPWKYAITLMDDHQLAGMRALVQAGVDPDEAASRALGGNTITTMPALVDDFGVDDDLDDAPAKPKRKRTRHRSIPRRLRTKKADAKTEPEPCREKSRRRGAGPRRIWVLQDHCEEPWQFWDGD